MVFKMEYLLKILEIDNSGYELELYITIGVGIIILLSIIILTIVKKIKD